MNSNKYEKELLKFRKIMNNIERLNNIINTLAWDMRVNLPPQAAEYRSEVIGYLSDNIYSLKVSDELKDSADYLESCEDNDEITKAMIKKAQREYLKLKSVPQKLYSDFAEHNLKSEVIWQEARKKNDYNMFKEYLKRQFDFKKEFSSCWGFEHNIMNGLMDETEPGMTTEKVDKIFEDLKSFICPFLDEIKNSKIQYSKKAIYGQYPIEKQRSFCKNMIKKVGYNLNAGRLDESAHPYTHVNNPNDVRITTRYFENDFTNAAISTMHELGHAVYWQNFSEKLVGTTLAASVSCGMDEGEARFFENIIGKSKSFWKYFLPIAKTYFSALDDMSVGKLYNCINSIHVNPVRLNADELTYNLHIIMRYEIEKMIFNGDVSYDDLPELWNSKCEDYFGVRPLNDSEGILQDMLWGSGYIGYFQNYVIGNFYDGHLLNKIKKDIPDMYEQIEVGNFKEILSWQIKNVYQYGAIYEPSELLMKITGEELSAEYYIEYLRDKFTEIYNL